MNSIKKYFMAGLFAISTIAISSHAMEIATTVEQVDPAFARAVAEELAKILKQGQISTDSIAGNFTQSGAGFVSAAHDIALGVSRLTYYGSVAISDWAKYLSEHYVVLGAFIASGAYFYWYVWPKITVRVHYNSDNPRPAGR